MKTEILKVTPEMAQQFLTRNAKNRKVKVTRVNQYANDMATGKWQESPEPISFYADGTLRDGQHRLMAVVKSGVSQDFLVVRDVPNDSTICDRGAYRTLSDIAGMSGLTGVSSPTAVGAVGFMLLAAAQTKGLTDSLKLEFMKLEYETLYDAVAIAQSNNRSGQVARKAPVMAAVYCALKCGVPHDTLRRFVEVLNSGHQRGCWEDAAITLRNQLLLDYRAVSGFQYQDQIFNVTLQAISDFREEQTRQRKYSQKKNVPYWPRVKAWVIDPFLKEHMHG